ncbi:U6 snRNA-associated sm-like protein lsm7, partial [Plakobranchus ocellatus]
FHEITMSQQQQAPQAGGDRRNDADREKKKKESILDLKKYLDKPIRVKFSGGRESK